MEDMATGEIRLSILWEWVHKSAVFTESDPETQVSASDIVTQELFIKLLEGEYQKLLQRFPAGCSLQKALVQRCIHYMAHHRKG